VARAGSKLFQSRPSVRHKPQARPTFRPRLKFPSRTGRHRSITAKVIQARIYATTRLFYENNIS